MKTFLVFALPSIFGCSSDPSVMEKSAFDSGLNKVDSAFVETEDGAQAQTMDGGYTLADGGFIRADRFVTHVVSFLPGDCSGFGADQMPAIVEGPPQGAGSSKGSTDVVSLGSLGTIVLDFGTNAIVDGNGPDFVVFENAFYVNGDANDIFAEPGEVSVSEDGSSWSTYPCTSIVAPYGQCAGWHPVLSSTGSGISPVDYPACGGDAFDLADLGLKQARFVRIHDIGSQACSADPMKKNTTNGFDLDAIAILNALTP